MKPGGGEEEEAAAAEEALRGLGCALEPHCSFTLGRAGDSATPGAAAAASYVVPELRAGRSRRGQGRGPDGRSERSIVHQVTRVVHSSCRFICHPCTTVSSSTATTGKCITCQHTGA